MSHIPSRWDHLSVWKPRHGSLFRCTRLIDTKALLSSLDCLSVVSRGCWEVLEAFQPILPCQQSHSHQIWTLSIDIWQSSSVSLSFHRQEGRLDARSLSQKPTPWSRVFSNMRVSREFVDCLWRLLLLASRDSVCWLWWCTGSAGLTVQTYAQQYVDW